MAIQRCPRCDLNYVKPGMEYCKVCAKEIQAQSSDESEDMCPVCGTNPIDSNQELCASCLNERVKMSGYRVDLDDENSDDTVEEDMDGMRVMELDNDDVPTDVRGEFDN